MELNSLDLSLDQRLISIDLQRSIHPSPACSAMDILSRLHAKGIGCYVMGGAVRDWIRGENARDIDIAISSTIGAAEAAIADLLGHIPHRLNYNLGTIAVLGSTGKVDITLMRDCAEIVDEIDNVVFTGGAPMERDAFARDFTINTFYYEPFSRQLFNPFPEGVSDLGSLVLRLIMDERKIAVDYRTSIRIIQFLARGYVPTAYTLEVLARKLDTDIIRYDDFGQWMNIYVPVGDRHYTAFKATIRAHIGNPQARVRVDRWFEQNERADQRELQSVHDSLTA
jgi:poly(A) polymerase